MKFDWDHSHSWWVNILAIIIAIVFTLGVAFGFMCLNSWLIMLLWNAILPALFGFSTITFWQTLGLYLILWLLKGGISKIATNISKNDD
jgi:hypothetical protein